MTLEYSDTLTATFTCTAFGGDGAQLEFEWTPENAFDSSPETEDTNPDNSTSTVTTNPLTLSERGDIICEVDYTGASSQSQSSAVLNIGKEL